MKGLIAIAAAGVFTGIAGVWVSKEVSYKRVEKKIAERGRLQEKYDSVCREYNKVRHALVSYCNTQYNAEYNDLMMNPEKDHIKDYARFDHSDDLIIKSLTNELKKLTDIARSTNDEYVALG